MRENPRVAATSEVEGYLAAAEEGAGQVARELESAKTLISELEAIRAALEAHSGQAREAAAQAVTALEATRAAAAGVTETAARVEALNAEAEQSAQLAATRSSHVEDGLRYVNERRSEFDSIITRAQQAATAAESELEASRATHSMIVAAHADSQATKAMVDADAAAVTAAKNDAEAAAAASSELADIAQDTKARITAYEVRLTGLQEASQQQKRTIDELLLGATNAGLASAFDSRSKSFKAPRWIWQAVFLVALGGLLILATLEARPFTAQVAPQWQDLARLLLHRLPFLIPLIWLAIHSGRQAALAMRMEEEYAFKATISTSFEGYRRQMAEVSQGLAPDSPLAKLCANTLETISTPPGQVYDKHRLDPTPATEGVENLKPILENLAGLGERLSKLKP